MKFFKPDSNWQYNSRISKMNNKWLFYGEGYREASELIEKQILEIDRSRQDFLIYPYCYLIRHYIEVRLKEIIDEGGKISNKSIKIPKHHDLAILWETSQKTLKLVWEEQFQTAPKDVSIFINEFHSIDVRSDSFRYPIDKHENENLKYISEINFEKLAEAFHDVKIYLDGVTDGIAAFIDNR